MNFRCGESPARLAATSSCELGLVLSGRVPASAWPYSGSSRSALAPVWRSYGIVPINATPAEANAAAATYDRFQQSARAKAAPKPYQPPERPASPAADEAYPNTTDLRYRGRSRHGAGLDFEHSAYVMLLDKQGEQRVGIPFEQLTPDGLARDMKLLLAER